MSCHSRPINSYQSSFYGNFIWLPIIILVLTIFGTPAYLYAENSIHINSVGLNQHLSVYYTDNPSENLMNINGTLIAPADGFKAGETVDVWIKSNSGVGGTYTITPSVVSTVSVDDGFGEHIDVQIPCMSWNRNLTTQENLDSGEFKVTIIQWLPDK